MNTRPPSRTATFSVRQKAAGAAVVGLALVLVLVIGAYQARYASWPGQEPARLHYCGRIYERGSRLTQLPEQKHPTFRAPPVVGSQVFTAKKTPCDYLAVDLRIFRSLGSGDYRVYVLLGGP